MKNFFPVLVCLGFLSAGLLGGTGVLLRAEDEHAHHGHTHEEAKKVPPPRLFLDKSPRVVWYQLNRLTNERLLAAERDTSDSRYVPVYQAILQRAGISKDQRLDALAALATLNNSNPIAELLAAVFRLDPKAKTDVETAETLTKLLVNEPASRLSAFDDYPDASHALIGNAIYAGKIAGGRTEEAWSAAEASEESVEAFFAAVQLIPTRLLTQELHDIAVASVDGDYSVGIKRTALDALARFQGEGFNDYALAINALENPHLRPNAIRVMLAVPLGRRPKDTDAEIVEEIVTRAEQTPASERTTDAFLDEIQLCEQLMTRLPLDDAKAYRDRLRAVTVRVIRINTVEEEMRYDRKFFVVEAGLPVQIILDNEDIMPHNLVVTVPGALQEVAELAAPMSPSEPGMDGKAYVPHSEKVLFATDMVQTLEKYKLNFTAPEQPGEYPYVCTFPRHWMRMYGVMLVVDDIDEWNKNPVEPKDPLGNNRRFVKAWTVDDFGPEISKDLAGRSREIGQRLFVEATCAQCHKMGGAGGAVGPALDDVVTRWKGDYQGVLREILDPSHKVDPKYAVQVVITDAGTSLSGIITAQDGKTVSLLSNPEAKKPEVISKSEILEMIPSATSMMPKGLLNEYSKDEILEILAYLAPKNE